MPSRPPAPAGTVEAWCEALITTTDLATKLSPAAPPDPRDPARWEPGPAPRRIARPGRPAELRVVRRSPRTPSGAALRAPEARARLIHTFLHHELQAAELFAWAVLAFPDAPRAFRAGLVALAQDELRHLALYRAHLARLGHAPGAWPVRDWFWERVPSAPDPPAFVALLGLGLEGANLDHAERFARWFCDAGDPMGADVLEHVARDEERHVAFAVTWFGRLTGRPLDYQRWRDGLPRPLTPSVLRGRPLNRAARRRAGLDDAFLDRLEAEPPAVERSPR